jgi:tetratricopeptide (TPR) repeat protein
VHVPSVLNALQVATPAPQIRAVGALQLPMVMTNLRLFISADVPFSADFGTLENSGAVHVPADDRIAAAIANPLDILLWRASINSEMRNHALAAQYYAQALALAPDSAEAQYGYAVASLALGDLDTAQTALNAAQTLGYPAQTRVLYAQAQLAMAQRDFPAAQLAFTQALDQFTLDNIVYGVSLESALYAGLGDSLIAQDRGLVAESIFTRALDLNPQNREAYLALYALYAAENRCDNAEMLRLRAHTFAVELPVSGCEGTSP